MNKIIIILFLIVPSSIFAQSALPNIIYILADDLGYGDVSAFNENSKLHTRRIDEIAANGMKFTDAHSGSAVCTPTRYGILTGRYAWRTHLQNGVLWGLSNTLIAPGRKTVADLLQKKGYHTACIGKWHLGLDWQKDSAGQIDYFKEIKGSPNTCGFDYFYGISASLDMPPYFYIENNHITATSYDSIGGSDGKAFWRAGLRGNDFKHEEVLPKLTTKALDYISEQAKNQMPFFLYFALPSPHTPILPAKEYIGKSGTNDYGDFVLMTDDIVGRILDVVKMAGIEENTIIIFTSDNGCSPSADFTELATAGHHPSYIFRGYKSDIFEGGHRIPFLVKWPGKVNAGTESAKTICLTDFTATMADALNIKVNDNEAEDSYSLIPLLLQTGKYKRDNIIHHSIDGNFAIREGKWKLEFASGSGGWSSPVEKIAKQNGLPSIQLYNLEKDTGETKNLAASYPRVVKRLTKMLRNDIENGRTTKGRKQLNDAVVKYIKGEEKK